ncbi:hypothetical protein ACFQE1_02170 [Halobium palmae]|uniref:Uncharacterized protein n=1 Tax=Halobium palmae TaxID=1776492 RepID=A0ABD5RWV1_9EURY
MSENKLKLAEGAILTEYEAALNEFRESPPGFGGERVRALEDALDLIAAVDGAELGVEVKKQIE